MSVFHFKQFSVDDGRCAMKVGTDAVLLGAWVDLSGAKTIVDAGCGSGVIALMSAQRSDDDTKIFAIDINDDACRDAEANVKAADREERITVVNADVTTATVFSSAESPMLIVSNPPFFNETLRSPDSARALARHGDEFGVEELIRLAASKFSSDEDSLAFIAPSSRADEIEFLLSLNRLSARRITTVFSRAGKPSLRTLWQVGRDSSASPRRLIRDELFIRDEANRFTPQYQSLTSDFYLDK